MVIDFKGSVDGEAFEGGAAEDFPLVLGSGSFIPGFEEQLVGVKAGDETEVKVTFPESYGAKHLAGKEAVLRGDGEGGEGAEARRDRRRARHPLRRRSRSTRSRGRSAPGSATSTPRPAAPILKRRLMDALDERVSFELPPTLVDVEARQIAHQLWHEEHHDHHGHDHARHRRRPRSTASSPSGGSASGCSSPRSATRTRSPSPTRSCSARSSPRRGSIPGQERQFLEFVQKNPQALQQIRAPLFEEKVVDYILELAQVTEKPVSKDELQKAIEAMDEEGAALAHASTEA